MLDTPMPYGLSGCRRMAQAGCAFTKRHLSSLVGLCKKGLSSCNLHDGTLVIINRKITVRALWVLKLAEPLRREIPWGGPLPEGLPDRPVPDNPEIPEIPEFPEFPEFPEAPMMPESRSRRSPGRLRASILSDVESIFGSISVLFRGSIG